MPNLKKFLYFSDIHVPFQDDAAIDWLVEQVREYKPDELICGGDILDCTAASKFDDEVSHDLSHEMELGFGILERIIDAAPDAKRVYLRGNHEDHIYEPSRKRIPKGIRNLVIQQFTDRVKAQGWKAIPYGWDHAHTCGDVTFIHGMEASEAGLRRQAVLMNKPYGLLVHGHIHRPDAEPWQPRYVGVPLPYYSVSSGCFVDFSRPMNYMRRARMDLWGHSIVRGEALQLKSPRRSVTWEAESVIRRMGPNSTKYHLPKVAA